MKDIIQFETAKLAKSLGIDMRSHYGYLQEKPNRAAKMQHAVQWYKGRFAAPKQSELQSVLRDEDIHISVRINGKTYEVEIIHKDKKYFYQDGYKSWEEALEGGLLEGLKIKQIPILLDELVEKTNRSKGQTKFLYDMLGGNMDKLRKLEMNIKNCFISYCPGDLKTADKIIDMKPKSQWFKL